MNLHHARFALWVVCNQSKYAQLSDDEKVLAAALLVERFATYQQAWETHPHFYPTALPVAMSVWQHEPFAGHSHSFICSNVAELVSPREMQWGEKTLGEFVGVVQVADWMTVSCHRITTLSWSLKGSGKAFRARMALKALLPAKYRGLVAKARHMAGQSKGVAWKGYTNKSWRDTPDEYRRVTADWLRLENFKKYFAERLVGIERYISVQNFWACATGKVHPEKVIQYITHQTSFM